MHTFLVVTQNPAASAPAWLDYLEPLYRENVKTQQKPVWQLLNFPEKLAIDDIRDLQNQLATIGRVGEYVFVLTDVHLATSVVQNAMLKILEEPPANVTFILTTTALAPILATIPSRCHILFTHQENIDTSIFPSLDDLDYTHWTTQNPSTLAALITKAFSDNQNQLKKTHPELTPTALALVAFNFYLHQITEKLPQTANLTFDRHVLACLANALKLLRANVSPKNVFYAFAIAVTTPAHTITLAGTS